MLISTAIAQLTYNSDDPRILSFPAGAKIEVYSYGAGLRDDLWGIKVNKCDINCIIYIVHITLLSFLLYIKQGN